MCLRGLKSEISDADTSQREGDCKPTGIRHVALIACIQMAGPRLGPARYLSWLWFGKAGIPG